MSTHTALQQLFATRTIRDAFVNDAWEGHEDTLTLADLDRLSQVAFDALPVAGARTLTDDIRTKAVNIIKTALVNDAWEGHGATLTLDALDRMATVAFNSLPTSPVERTEGR